MGKRILMAAILALTLSAGAAGDRLAISFSIWALYDMVPGGTFADPAKTMEGLKERGYNAIRLDDGAGLYAAPDGTPRGKVRIHPMFGEYSRKIRQQPVSEVREMDMRENLVRFCRAADACGMKVILSSWYYLHTNWMTDEAINAQLFEGLSVEQKMSYFTDELCRILSILRENRLDRCVAFVELFNEFDGLYFTGDYGKIKDLAKVEHLRSLHEAAIARLKREHHGVKVAYDVWTPRTQKELVPRNADVLNFHHYYYWDVYRDFEQGAVRKTVEEIPIPDGVRPYLVATPPTIADITATRRGNLRVGNDWNPRVRLYAALDEAKIPEVERRLSDVFEKNRASYLQALRDGIAQIRKIRDEVLPGAPLVMGEGGSYCAANALRFEEHSDSFWAMLREQAKILREEGVWGAVPRTTSGPEDPSWGMRPDDLRRVNDLFRLGEQTVRWSYPPQAWPRWEIQKARAYTYENGMNVGYPVVLSDVAQNATFRGKDGKTLDVSASSQGGVPCVRGDGWKVKVGSDKWVDCDVFEGTEKTPPHLLGHPPVKGVPTFGNGLYSAEGETVAFIWCRSAKRPVLRVGESREEALSEDLAGFEQNVRMEPTGKPDEWRSVAPLAFRHYRFVEPVEETWFVRDEMRRPLVGTYRSDDERLNRIWRASAETVRLCTRRFFVDAVKRDRMPWPGDDAIAFLADWATYRNAEAARFTIDALGCAEFDGLADYSPWWVIINGLYRRLYGDPDFIRRRWSVIRRRTDALSANLRKDGAAEKEAGRNFYIDWGDRGNPTAAYNVLMFAAFDTAAALAVEQGKTEDAVRWSAQAGKVADALKRLACDPKTGLFRCDIDDPSSKAYRQPNLLAVLFGLVKGAEAQRIGDALAKDDLPGVGTAWMAGLECIALMTTGHGDVVPQRIDRIWGGMVDLGFNTIFEHWWPDAEGAEAFRFYGRPFGLSLCHIASPAPAYLLPALQQKDFRNPFETRPPELAFLRPCTDKWTADPTARVFDGRLYLYTSHDQDDVKGHYESMTDWLAFSTDDLWKWTDYGVFFGLKDIFWASHHAWAPDVVRHRGRYYLFYPVERTKIGVAVSDDPVRGYRDIGRPLVDNAGRVDEIGPEPIDPSVIVVDGKGYLFFGCRELRMVELDGTLTNVIGEVRRPIIRGTEGRKEGERGWYGEGPFVFRRGEWFYLMYSDGWSAKSTLVYARAKSVCGPWDYIGPIMPNQGCSTSHGSIAEFRGKWYVFYHDQRISRDGRRRSVLFSEIAFDVEGRIVPLK